MKFKIIIIFIILLIAVNASAELTIKEYLKDKNNRDVAIFISGLAVGMGWVNTELRMTKRQPLFCIPEKLVLNVKNYQEILDRLIQEMRETRTSRDDEYTVGLILLEGLKETFPCKDNTQ